MTNPVEEALARRKAQQEAADKAVAENTELKEPTLEEKMQSALAAQAEGAKLQGVTTASTESGTGVAAIHGVEAIRNMGADSPNPAIIAQNTISPNPQLQKSQARLAEESAIPQSAGMPTAAVSTGSGVALTAEQLEAAKKILGISDAQFAKKEPALRRSARTFQHLFAGAGVNLPDGRRLTFGGHPGGVGIYVTDRADEISYLEELSMTPGSQVTEPGVTDDSTKNALQQAVRDSRKNTELDLDPNVQAARNALGTTIARG